MRYTELDLAAVPDRYVLIGRCMLPTCTVLWYMYMAVSERCSVVIPGWQEAKAGEGRGSRDILTLLE